ncbi:MAG: heme NO-binding domain-containing protein [Actinobacteria bacterium]|nr:heme NO-binding domain-containing protein [Actinomycetota bacterium]
MKGIMFNLLEEVISSQHDEETWDTVLAAAGADGAYTSLGSYPDDEFMRLVDIAAQMLDRTAYDTLRWLGRRGLPLLAERYPGFFQPHASAEAFVLTVNGIIHPEVRKLLPRAGVPEFGYEPGSNGDLRLGYRSPRKLCALAEGFIEGAADLYGEHVDLHQSTCMHRGDERCVLELRFHR